MCICQVSGAVVAEVDDEEFCHILGLGGTIKALKQCLAARTGFSRFRQRLLAESGELHDDMPLSKWPELQLVILEFCPPERTLRCVPGSFGAHLYYI